MKVKIDHVKLTSAASQLEGLADRMDAERARAQSGTPIGLPTLSASALGTKSQWMRDQLPMMRGLASIGILLETKGSTVSEFDVGEKVEDIMDLLGDTLADKALNVGGHSITGMSVVAAWMEKGKLGKFAPRGPNGRYIKWKNSPAWKNVLRMTSKDNWSAKPYQSASRTKWMTASKWAGRAGGVLTFGTAALDQWNTDSQDPSIDTSEKVGRSAVKGGTTLAGAWGGAQLGAAIGGFGGPIGIVAGGLIGGAIGGFLGSEAGDVALDLGKDLIKDASKGIENAGEAVGDFAGDVGDKLSFWN